MQNGLTTPEVMSARAQLIVAVEAALVESGLDRDAACAKLSALLADLWNLLESRARRLPPPKYHRLHAAR